MVRLSLAMALTAIGMTPALAQSALPPVTSETVLTLSAQAEKTLPRDRLEADLRVEAVGASPARVQAEINRRMAKALAEIKGVGLTAATAGYAVYPENEVKGGPMRWHGSQSLRIVSGHFSALLDLVGVLQAGGLALSNLSATLSPAAADAAQNELTDAAIKRLETRAARIAATLGTRIERYAELRVGNVSASPIPIRAMAASALGAAPPVIAAGNATVAIRVDATVILAPVR